MDVLRRPDEFLDGAQQAGRGAGEIPRAPDVECGGIGGAELRQRLLVGRQRLAVGRVRGEVGPAVVVVLNHRDLRVAGRKRLVGAERVAVVEPEPPRTTVRSFSW